MAQLHLNTLGMIPASYPKTFYRVEDYRTGRRIADFSSRGEAQAASYASRTGLRYDHKVCEMHVGGA